MDQAVRNKLRSTVTQCRRLLEDAVEQTLQGRFGVYVVPRTAEVHREATEKMTHLGEEDQRCRADLLAHLDHIATLGYSPTDALAQLVREIAFTHLNRLCAYKMMEARQVYVGDQRFREAVSRGVKSQGFQFFLADHPASEQRFNEGHQDEAYRQFLDWLGGTLSTEIGILFSPDDPANRLYPPQRVLDEVLALINDDALADIWTQDETIGWVYQYFTPKGLRDQVRAESQAPRNSYELAFRNQFFTPRYVVEFLTDNTLGRIWYEMRKGGTRLTDQCRYMVRRPSEVFLAEGQNPPEDTVTSRDDLSQEELLKLPVYIPHRPKKDPRELKILDPACGSGHFLLYCFDLLFTIYEEAYADSDLGPTLQRDYPTLDALRRVVPRLILANNLHGIDIDLRASQIAALALWLRCQKAYQDMGIKKDRPRITRSNFVCAEPMPGEDHMLQEFVAQIEPKLLGQLVEVVFDKMKLAGEAGSLLKIEEEIRDAVAEARRQWVVSPVMTQRNLFDTERPRIGQQRFDFSGITDAQFFEEAEEKVVEALRNYAEKAQDGDRLQRRLFTEDAVRGFAFVELCHKRFDVVLMNPPFGEGSRLAKPYVDKFYPRTKNDLYAAFVERGLNLLGDGGFLGAITSRTGFFLSSFQKWREEILLGEATPTVFADLGEGVLDTAMVETAAYCLCKRKSGGVTALYRLTQLEQKQIALADAIEAGSFGKVCPDVFHTDVSLFQQIPGSPFAYWLAARVRRIFKELPRFESGQCHVRCGMGTLDDFRFLRCWWEVPQGAIGRTRKWVFFAKGGVSSPFYSPIYLVVNYGSDGRELKDYVRDKVGSETRKVQAQGYYYRPGLTFGRRIRKFAPAVLPADCIFSDSSNAVFWEGNLQERLLFLLGVMSGQFVAALLSLYAPLRKMEVGFLQRMPFPVLADQPTEVRLVIASHSMQAFAMRRQLSAESETDIHFASIKSDTHSLSESVRLLHQRASHCQCETDRILRLLNSIALESYGFSEPEHASVMQSLLSPVEDVPDEGSSSSDDEFLPTDMRWGVANFVSHGMGCAFGRWDIRYATGEKDTPKLPDPFDPLPTDSLGILKADEGCSLSDTLSRYPLGISREGILVDDPEHGDDIIQRVRVVIEAIWKDRAESIEKEVCELLVLKDLRDYFRKSGKGGFWDDHVLRYSQSRRKAPIYWLLQSSKKNYALWLYYHCLDKDTLFKALHNYVVPKIRHEDSQLGSLKTQRLSLSDSNRGARKLDKDIEKQDLLLSELRDFEDKLRRAANLAFALNLDTEIVYDPDLNDGVVLNIAPLHELVPWKEAKSYWQELLAGKYEWSSMGKLLRKKGLVKA